MKSILATCAVVCGTLGPLAAQTIAGFNLGDQFEYETTLVEGPACTRATIEGTTGKSSVKLNVGFLSVKDGLSEFALNGSVRDFIGGLVDVAPVLECRSRILNVSGAINSYLVTADPNSILTQPVSGQVSHTDYIEVYSPVNTTIELPFHASAGLASVQTFCEPDDSEAVAMASLTVTVNGRSTTASGTTTVKGAFLETSNPRSSSVAVVPVRLGLNYIALDVSGELSVVSTVRGINGAIVCGSNAVAVAGNSLTVDNFTGPNGGPLPEGMTIRGITTGIDYRNPGAVDTCAGTSIPEIEITDAGCGQNNGLAFINLSEVEDPITSILWSTGQKGPRLSNLAPGDYTATLAFRNGCSRQLAFRIADPSLPKNLLPTDTVLTTGETLTLTATPPNDTLSYAWSTGDVARELTVSEPGRYTVTVTGPGGCAYDFATTVISDRAFTAGNETITTNSGLFYDDGGIGADYSGDQNRSVTICPEKPGKYTVLDFTLVDIQTALDLDKLSVFDGRGNICPLNTDLQVPARFQSSTPDGCLTVRFRANSRDRSRAGWEATISTVDTASRPSCYAELACGTPFTDPAGATEDIVPGDYRVYYLQPTQTGEVAELTFSDLDLRSVDRLSIYDGRGTDCLLTDAPTTGTPYRASDEAGGFLTVVYAASSSSRRPARGWEAEINCRRNAVNTTRPCRYEDTPLPGNTCQEAPLIENLQDFYVDLNFDYTADAPGDLNGRFLCGNIHNNAFYRFRPTAPTAEIGYAATGGNTLLCEGFQLAVFTVDGRCDSPNARWNMIACTDVEDGLSSDGTFSFDGLDTALTYYLMIDGIYGSECRVALNPERGIATCPLRVGAETTTCEEGSYFVDIPLTGGGDGSTYRVYDAGDYFGEIDTLTFTHGGPADTITVGPYRSGTDYDIRIVGNGPLACNLGVGGGGPDCDPPVCDLSANFTATCIDGDTLSYLLEGNIDRGRAPYSIVGGAYRQFLFPDEGTAVSDTLPRSALSELTVTDFNRCSVTVPIMRDCTTATHGLDDPCLRRVSLWPNPVGTRLRLSGTDCTDLDYAVVDVSGRTLLHGLLPAGGLEVSHLRPGVYFLRLRGRKGERVLRFVKL